LLASRDRDFAVLAQVAREARDGPERNRHFQRMFEVVAARWITGELTAPGVESWQAFCHRVRGGMRRVLDGAGNRRAVLFTSGGVIGLFVQTVLGAPEAMAIQLNWRVRNCSLTEFVFSRDRLSLDSFNAIPHLDDPSMQSFR
jgi:broad specificity phosphatase PhoE